MFISKAYAQTLDTATQLGDEGALAVGSAMREAPSAAQAFMWNMGLVALLVVMFYVLLIRPQQKRMREHATMLQGLRKGDAVVTSGGLVGRVAKIKEGDDEVKVDLGNDIQVTVLRSMLQQKSAAAPQAKTVDKKAPLKDAPNDNPKKAAKSKIVP